MNKFTAANVMRQSLSSATSKAHLVSTIVAVLLALSMTTGCATGANRPGGANTDSAIKMDREVVGSSASAKSPGHDLDDSGADLNQIPNDMNQMVFEWIDYFQGRGREHMERYLARSSRYIPIMKETLRKEGLPEDLVYVALIESGFSPVAHSSANAVGHWQFIRETGKRYGLRIDSYVDDRRDFVKATVAAADYFKGLYNLFGSWYLAIASYNSGENRVKNVVMRYRTRDFWQLARDGTLPKETTNYIPKFLAARLIAKDPEKYGFKDIDYAPAVDFAEVEMSHSVDLKKLAASLGVDEVEIKDLNPAYKRGVAFDQNGHLTLRIPRSTVDRAPAALEAAMVVDRSAYKIADEDDIIFYKIRRGESIGAIARKFHTTTRKIRSLNGLSAKGSIVAGHKIKVPNDMLEGIPRRHVAHHKHRRSYASKKNSQRKQTLNDDEVKVIMRKPAAHKVQLTHPAHAGPHLAAARSANQNGVTRITPQNGATRSASQHSAEPKIRYHIVQRGDSLAKIAQHYRVSVSDLTETNQIKHGRRVAVGTKLEIPE